MQLILEHASSEVEEENAKDALEQRNNDEIKMMLDPLKFQNAFERTMLFNLLDENGNLPHYFGQSSAFRARSHWSGGSPFLLYFEVSPNFITRQHDERQKRITNSKTCSETEYHHAGIKFLITNWTALAQIRKISHPHYQ